MTNTTLNTKIELLQRSFFKKLSSPKGSQTRFEGISGARLCCERGTRFPHNTFSLKRDSDAVFSTGEVILEVPLTVMRLLNRCWEERLIYLEKGPHPTPTKTILGIPFSPCLWRTLLLSQAQQGSCNSAQMSKNVWITDLKLWNKATITWSLEKTQLTFQILSNQK